jgi:hypothetical protein
MLSLGITTWTLAPLSLSNQLPALSLRPTRSTPSTTWISSWSSTVGSPSAVTAKLAPILTSTSSEPRRSTPVKPVAAKLRVAPVPEAAMLVPSFSHFDWQAPVRGNSKAIINRRISILPDVCVLMM